MKRRKKIKKNVNIVLGLQWGDEGKGKIIDFLVAILYSITKRFQKITKAVKYAVPYKIVTRAQGGPNAGHTLKFDTSEIVLNTIPSGICCKGTKNIIGSGVVIDPAILVFKEIEELISKKILTFEEIQEKLFISKKAHLILPSHSRLDAISEEMKGKDKIGSTLKGICPTYKDKYGRDGLRIKDITDYGFIQKYRTLKAKHAHIAKSHGFELEDEKFLEKEEMFLKAIKIIKQLQLIDSEIFLNEAIENDEHILAEGAQGTMLDIDFGTYPFVTSSNTISGGICTGLGIAPNKINEIFGIFKAYCTRVGSGSFPTELFDKTGELLRKKGGEFGSTTGRPRRCGWLDLVALKYAIMLNGVTKLIMTKADILNDFDEVLICTHYILKNGTKVDIALSDEMEGVKPIYEAFNGWNNLSKKSSDKKIQLDKNFQKYVDFIEKHTGVLIVIIGTGPKRNDIIVR